METKTIGERLREERERLGMSQAAFGALGGVLKLAQLNYEKGARSPPYQYFKKLRERTDADVWYILSGVRTGDSKYRHMAEAMVGMTIASQLGLTANAFTEAVEIAVRRLLVTTVIDNESVFEEAKDDALQEIDRVVSTEINKSPRVIDESIIKELFVSFDAAISNQATRLSPEKKAQAFAMLYRTAKSSGRVDPQVVQDAISLAT